MELHTCEGDGILVHCRLGRLASSLAHSRSSPFRRRALAPLVPLCPYPNREPCAAVVASSSAHRLCDFLDRCRNRDISNNLLTLLPAGLFTGLTKLATL